jgi:hypothetical protein
MTTTPTLAPCIHCATPVPPSTRCPQCGYGEQGPEGLALGGVPLLALVALGSVLCRLLVWALR